MVYQPVEVVEVLAWGERVGAVALDQASGFYAFEYAPRWRRRGVELAPLQMPVRARPYVFPSLPEETFHRLPAMLADSLPDAFGNAIVNAALAREGVSADQVTALDRLAYLGSRGVGALEFRPARMLGSSPTAVKLGDLVVAARSALSGSLVTEADVALSQLIAVGTSAGGARAKAVVAWNRETGEMRSGQLPAPDGFEHWLLKFDGMGEDAELGAGSSYGRIEFAYHLMARAAGIVMEDCHLLVEGSRAHFMTRRFDRVGNEKVHVVSLCAMAHLDFNQVATHDYAQYFQVIDRLGLGADARQEAFRRMVFNVAAVNRDDHTKNFAFTLADGGSWQLAPAYDVTFAHNPHRKWTARHQMAVNGRFEGITLADVGEVADRFKVPAWRDVVAQVVDAVDRWESFAEEAQVAEVEVVRIREAMDRFRLR